MQTFARVIDSTVWELVRPPEGVSIEEMYTPDFVEVCVNVTSVEPKPAQGWVYEAGTFSEPEPPEMNSAEILARNISTRDFLLGKAGLAIGPLQDAADLDVATDSETLRLREWKQYRVAVNRADVSLAEVTWPPEPS